MGEDASQDDQPAQPAPEARPQEQPERAPERKERFGFLKKAREQRQQGERNARIGWKERWAQWMRVLAVARKPTKDEFVSSSKVSAAGIVIIGAIGLAIFLAFIGIGI